ncbi:MAG: hypothetical protein RR361_03885 [Anaerovorax sp.]
MKELFNKIINANHSSIYLVLYGMIAQIVAWPLIFVGLSALEIPTILASGLIYAWSAIPTVAVISIIIAIIQIKRAKNNNEKSAKPFIGIIISAIWIIGFVLLIHSRVV